MPSSRRGRMRESWRKRGGPSPALEIEAQDLRIVAKRIVMDQKAETNGCDNSPVSVGVSNHNEIVQCSPKLEKQMAKSLSTHDGKKSRSAASNAKGSRGRRNITPSTPTNSTSTTSPSSERRATRHVAQPSTVPQTHTSPAKPVSRTLTAAERKAAPKISTPSPATNVQSSKKISQQHQQPPILSLASSEGAPLLLQETTSPNARLSKHSHQSPVHTNPPLLKSQKRGHKRQHVEVGSGQELMSRASKRVRLQHQPFQSPPPPTVIPAILRQQTIKTPEDKIVVFQKG